jgi:hypothetical protein
MEQLSQGAPACARRSWTNEDQCRAEELRSQGLSYQSIGAAIGFSGQAVRYRLDPAAKKKAAERRRRHYESHREAIRERARLAYWANPEPERERSRRYNADHQQERLEYDRRWRDANREWVRERNRRNNKRWRQANLERSRENARRRCRKHYAADPARSHRKCYLWHRTHPDASREIARRRYAAKKSGRIRSLVPADLAQVHCRLDLFGGRCAYCGSAERITIDHVLALSKGGLDESSNLAPACRSCNSSKRAQLVEDWYHRQPFFSKARWQKIQRHCPGAASGQLPLALGLLAVA